MGRSVSVARWLIKQAACRAPTRLASRLEEEWLADLEARDSNRSRFFHALGCHWAACVLSYQEPRPQPAPTTAWLSKGALSSPDGELSYFSLRSGTVFLIVGLHAALCCVLVVLA
jgi:hypothetical protein